MLRAGASALVGSVKSLPQAAAALTSPQTLLKGADQISSWMGMGLHPYGIGQTEGVPEWAKHADGLSNAITNSTHAYTDFLGGLQSHIESGLTPSFKEAAQKNVMEGIKDPEWYLNGISQAAAYAIPTAGPVVAASRLAYASKMLALADEAIPMSVKAGQAMEAAQRAGTAVGAVANSAIMGGQTGQDVRDTLEKLDEPTLMNYPEYRKAREAGKSDTEARQEFISNRANQATLAGAAAADLPAASLNRFVAHAAVGQAIARTTAGAALKGSIEAGVAGAVGMTGMTAAEKSQEAEHPDFFKAVKDSKDEALTGAIIGAFTGGLTAGGAHGRIAEPEAAQLARSQAADKSAADIRKTMQDKADATAAEEADKRQKAGVAAGEEPGAAGRAEAKAERVTAEQAQETHETLQRARQDFIAAHQRVQTLEAHVSDPSVPVSYNQLESARAARARAYNEFHEAADAAGILTTRSQAGKVQDNGRAETEGSDGAGQRRAGTETNGVRGTDQRGAPERGQQPRERAGELQGTERQEAERHAPEAGDVGLKPLTPEEGPTHENLGGPLTAEKEQPVHESGAPSEFKPVDRDRIAKTEAKKGVSDKQYAANYSEIPASDRNLSTEQKKVESRMKAIVADVPTAERAYAELPGTQSGRIINTDDARQLSPDYNKDNQSRALHANSVQEPASWLADKLFFRRMAAEPSGDKSVLFTAGGSDAGKSASLRSEDAKKADTVYDGNMNNLPKARRRIKAALESGRNVKIQFTYRDPIDAFTHGVLPRAMKFGRTVPAEVHADTHNGSFKAVMALAKQYEKDDRVQIGVTDVSDPKVQSLKDIAAKRYEVSGRELRDIAIKEFKRGNITETVLRGVGGESAVRLARRGEDHGRVPGEPVVGTGARPDTGGEAGAGAEGHPAREGRDTGVPQAAPGLGENVPGKVQVERRANVEKRKKIDEMTPAEMRRELMTHPLTGLPNKRAFEEHGREAVQASIDVNSLKWHNDEGGHATGDRVLKAVGKAMREAAVRHDVVPYHFSGDEFAMEGERRADVEAAIKDVKDALAKEVVRSGENETHGITIAHGIGDTFAEADAKLQPEKERQERAGERAARGEMPPGTRVIKSLEGMPTKVVVPGHGEVEFGPLAVARDAAEKYTKAAGIDYHPPQDFKHVNIERAKAIARAYEDMKHDPSDPAVKASYDAMIKETLAQWKEIERTGLKVEFMKPGMKDPYADSPRLAIMDAKNNNHLWVFPTDAGFGHEGSGLENRGAEHPLLAMTDQVVDGEKRRANDIFRIVHDYFGHIKEGNGFRADGEENAWRQHAAMYSDLARGAMTTETRGQNSWVNYGPHGDANRVAKGSETVYAPQKAGLLPEQFWHDGGDQSFKVEALRFRHFSNLTDEKVVLDPNKYGTGLRGEEAKRIAAGAPKVIAAYAAEHPDRLVEYELRGKTEYAIEVHPRDMYDLSRDPQEIIAGATKGGVYDHTKAELAIKKLGYKGYYLPGSEGAWKGQARFFGKMKAERVTTVRDREGKWGGKVDDIPLSTAEDRVVINNGGIDRDTRTRVKNRIKRELGMDVQIVEHPRDVPDIDRWAAENLPITGVFTDGVDGGTIHLIAGNLGSEDHAVTAAYHEIVGHYGTRAMLGGRGGEHYNTVMDRIANSFPDLTKKMAARNGIQLQHADKGIRDIRRRSAAEEVIAYAAEQRAQNGERAPIYQRIVTMIRDFMRSVGLLYKYNEGDIASLIDRSAEFVRRGGAKKLAIRDELSHQISGKPRDYAFQTAYHGTPHEFTEFDARMIGSGEGNQTFGHGLYFAENRETAEHYRTAIGARNINPGTAMERAVSAMEDARGDRMRAYQDLKREIDGASKWASRDYQQKLRQAQDLVKSGNAKRLGNIYQVHIPDESVRKMLNWDAKFNEQPPVVQKAMRRLLPGGFPEGTGDLSRMDGGDLYMAIANSIDPKSIPSGIKSIREETSRRLREAGVPGVHYLDEGSRNPDVAKQTRNIVLFNPEDARITHVNDKPVGGEQAFSVKQKATQQEKARAILGDIAQHLTEQEKAKLGEASAKKMIAVIKNLPDVKEFAAAALAGKAKRGWYRQSAEAIANVFGPDGPRFAALLASLSPQVSVETNLRNAIHTWVNWHAAGRPTDRKSIMKIMGESVQGDKGEKSVLGAWRNNAVRSLTHPDPGTLTISGPKVNSFMRNLVGHSHEVTLDTWMANFAKVEQKLFAGSLKKSGIDPGKRPGYLGYSARVREAAEVVTKMTGERWTPAEIQETIWSWAKTAYEHAEKHGDLMGNIPEMVRNKDITDELIKATPDFKTLFHHPEYEPILRAAGYGDRLDELRAAVEPAEGGPATEAETAARQALSAHLDAAAERLEALRQERRAAGQNERGKTAQGKMQFQVSAPDSPEMASFLAKINPKSHDQRGLKERVNDILHGLQQGVMNEFHGIERAYKAGGGNGPNIGFMKAELTRNSGQLLTSTIKDGVPIWRGGEVGLDTSGGGYQDILAPLGGKVEDWFSARVARRAQRLMAEGREHNFTPEEIAAGQKLWDNNPEFEKAFQARAAFASRILDFAQEAGVINAEGRPTWENADHIPFYRLANDAMDLSGGASAGRSIGRVKEQVKRLKGGAAPIGDPMENELKNWGSLLKASLHNQAMTRVVEDMRGMTMADGRPFLEAGKAPTDIKISKEEFKQRLLDTGIDPASLDQNTLDHLYSQQHGIPEDPNTVWHMVNGQKVYWKVNDPMLYQSLVQLNSGAESQFMKFWSKWIGAPARLLRRTIVNSPVFAAKIAVRHTQYLWVTGRYGSKNIGPEFKPIVDSVRGFWSIMRNSEEAQQMKAAGGLFSDAQAYGEPVNAARRLKLSLSAKSVPGTVLSSLAAVGDFYHRFLNAAEGMNRIAIANSSAKAGGSRTEQMYAARKVLDYTQHGSHWLTKMLITSVPFTTGHLAGVDALRKQAVNNPVGFALRGGMLAAASVAYAYLNHSNPQYQALPDDQKTAYFHFFNVFKDGDHWQLPKSFEDGSVFVTIPEAMTDMALSSENDRVQTAARISGKAIMQTFGYDFMPTELRPIYDIATNRQSFSGAPILTQKDLSVDPAAQDAPYVSPTIRAAAHAVPDWVPSDTLKSPKQMQYLASGYLGTVGQYVTGAADAITRRVTGETAPAGHGGITSVPSVNQIYREGPMTRTKQSDSMYTIANQIAKDWATEGRLFQGGNIKGAIAFNKAHEEEFKVREIYQAATKQAAEIRKYQLLVQQDKSMSPEEKQRRIDASQKNLNSIAERVYHFRPGGPLSKVATKLIGASISQKASALRDAGLSATASIVSDMAA